MSTLQPLVLELPLSRGAVRVTFARHHDRWAHEMSLVAGQTVIPLLSSLEGTSTDDWPPSPPLQEVHREEWPADTLVALAVGRAGTAYWSASIKLERAERRIEFDLACRTPTRPAEIGSRYRLLSPESLCETDAAGLVLSAAGIRLAIDGAQQIGNELWIAPTEFPARYPATLRWSYVLRALE